MSVPQYFAQVNDDNIVIDVAVVTHLFMQENPERYPGTWIETFIGIEGKTYAGVGFTWNGTDFEPPADETLIS